MDTDSLKEFNAIIYYSPVAPIHETLGSLSDEGKEPDGISSVNIQMLRTGAICDMRGMVLNDLELREPTLAIRNCKYSYAM